MHSIHNPHRNKRRAENNARTLARIIQEGTYIENDYFHLEKQLAR